MAFGAWRGSVGLIIPVRRPGILEQIQSVVPRGVCFFPAYNRIRHGSREEFSKALDECEKRVAECAEVGVDLINPMGAPPFMILGYKGEAETDPEAGRRNTRRRSSPRRRTTSRPCAH